VSVGSLTANRTSLGSETVGEVTSFQAILQDLGGRDKSSAEEGEGRGRKRGEGGGAKRLSAIIRQRCRILRQVVIGEKDGCARAFWGKEIKVVLRVRDKSLGRTNRFGEGREKRGGVRYV